MKSYSVSQIRVNKLLKYRDEKIALLNKLKGSSTAREMLVLEIKSIELSLFFLDIDFERSNVHYSI